MELYFITSNPGKFKEVCENLAPLGYTVKNLKIEYPELQVDTLDEVAKFGVDWLNKKVDNPFIIEDSGLFIEALNNFPGVYSAYVFKTIGHEGILKLLKNKSKRSAYFESCIGYFNRTHAGKSEVLMFKGKCAGYIAKQPNGNNGFGYDPIFVPKGETRTFAEMSAAEKNRVSHRGKALKQFIKYLETGKTRV